MRKKSPKGPLENARDALRDIWDECFLNGCIGRSWGVYRKGQLSAIPGSTIILSDGRVMIVIFSEKGNRYGALQIKTFGQTGDSDLEDRIRQTLNGAGLI